MGNFVSNRNDQKFQNCLEGSNIESSENDVITSNNHSSLENLCNIKRFSRKQKTSNSPNDHTHIFKKELFVVIENSYNDVIRDMVNSTAQHPKTRNSKVAINCNSNNNSTCTQMSTVKEHVTEESILIMTSKSTCTPVLEVINVFICKNCV